MSRLTIFDLEVLARKRYPDKARDSYWIEKYAQMQSKIAGWERRQSAAGLVLLIREELRTTRSPGKRQAIQDFWDDKEKKHVEVQEAAATALAGRETQG